MFAAIRARSGARFLYLCTFFAPLQLLGIGCTRGRNTPPSTANHTWGDIFEHSPVKVAKKEVYFSVPVSKHSNIWYWLRHLNFHGPLLKVVHGFQIFGGQIPEIT